MRILPIGNPGHDAPSIRPGSYLLFAPRPPERYAPVWKNGPSRAAAALRHLLPLWHLRFLLPQQPLNEQAVIAALGLTGRCPWGIPCADKHPLPAILARIPHRPRLNPDPDAPNPEAQEPPPILELRWHRETHDSAHPTTGPTDYPPSIVIIPGTLLETLI